MTFEDSINVPKPKKDAPRGVITEKQAKASLDAAAKAFGEARFGLLRAERGNGVVSLLYGLNGRALDASGLAYELNN
ncbi:hypothetical protein LB559_13480 [Mesorhizobium sp. BR1-1-3]|uniref:hypothetical protein n=1 Tax=Mesorhizobium sp. BR1-1-3 TaxID=2876651 RepID=UPI001CD16F64|nr:hypothetical protein [Mesorhizobium sp. BR1-1-3]MBZ9888955.1 hypothetical protein [Mesorhizobium sp. BR1-1-3]